MNYPAPKLLYSLRAVVPNRIPKHLSSSLWEELKKGVADLFVREKVHIDPGATKTRKEFWPKRRWMWRTHHGGWVGGRGVQSVSRFVFGAPVEFNQERVGIQDGVSLLLPLFRLFYTFPRAALGFDCFPLQTA